MSNRPSRRTLVRWNDDHDKELLMWMVYCSAEQGIKLPWARIAQCMGPHFTEGACTQHLAKIRTRMEEQGLHVPPPQKRGTATRTGSSIYRPKKPKDVNDSVPRVRPDIAPPPPDQDYAAADEEEEEIEGNLETISSIGGRTARKTVRQQSSIVAKDDSSEDEPVPVLYDSDNEYGARRTRTSSAKRTQSRAPPKPQMAVNIAGRSADEAGDKYQVNTHIMQSSPPSPSLKLESIEDSMSDFAPSIPPKQQGTRRKSSAMVVDDDDEYEPEGRGRSQAKKPRSNRNRNRDTKKTKVNDKVKADSKRTDVADEAGHSEAVTYDADRAAMPPPPLPYTNNVTGFGWNTSFMQQPFMNSSVSSYSSPGLDANAYYDHSPTSNSFDNFHFSTGDATFNAYQRPGLDYLTSGLIPTTSAPSTRNHSFGSIASTSTADSSPRTWNQPMRSPGFPNPQEATKVLHRALNAPEDEPSTRINMFRPFHRDSEINAPWSGKSFTAQLNHDADDDMVAEGADSEGLFFGPPPELLSDDFLGGLMSDQALD